MILQAVLMDGGEEEDGGDYYSWAKAFDPFVGTTINFDLDVVSRTSEGTGLLRINNRGAISFNDNPGLKALEARGGSRGIRSTWLEVLLPYEDLEEFMKHPNSKFFKKVTLLEPSRNLGPITITNLNELRSL